MRRNEQSQVVHALRDPRLWCPRRAALFHPARDTVFSRALSDGARRRRLAAGARGGARDQRWRARDRLAPAAAREEARGTLFPRQWRLAATARLSLPCPHRGWNWPRSAELSRLL